jgi:allantoinase
MGPPLLPDVPNFPGKAPRSWESPGLTETTETIDLLRQNGIEYLADWVIDDLPQDIATPHGTITTIPYSVKTKYLEQLLDYVIGHDGVALMTASQIGDWYRSELATSSARTGA